MTRDIDDWDDLEEGDSEGCLERIQIWRLESKDIWHEIKVVEDWFRGDVIH